VAYLPRGPLIAGGDAVTTQLLQAIDTACKRRHTSVLIVEPDRPLPQAWTNPGSRFASGPAPFQASRTVKVPLVDDEALLGRMRKDTRNNVLHAQRRGVIVEQARPDAAAITTFYELLRESSRRNNFGIHPRSYYADFLQEFGDQATLLFAREKGIARAGLIVARWGEECRSMYAGSSVAYRGRGDSALIRFEAMRWARGQGCTHFDLGGIAPGHSPDSSSASDLQGVNQFKVGFGGVIVTYPPTVERRYRPLMAWSIRRFNARFQSVSRHGMHIDSDDL
jgi:lipid II:glycine glycyltransferase (peptidoglycan interpeptide bridge formation enzyme)